MGLRQVFHPMRGHAFCLREVHGLFAGKKFAVFLAVLGCSYLAGCASGPPPAPQVPPQPIDQVLARFAALHNQRDVDALRAYFAPGAKVRSPAMPRPGSPDAYLSALLAEPFNMQVSDTRVLYANETGAKTRGNARLFAPARFTIDERIEVLWKLVDGRWKIVELDYPQWPPVVGTWRKAGLRGEPSIELRLMPGGGYLVYADKDRIIPTFRGQYQVRDGTVFLTDSSAADSSSLDTSEGRYAMIVLGPNAQLRKISDGNSWRSERFEGTWSAAR
jgi:outer membrane murein-binding lipoprotein Lpp